MVLLNRLPAPGPLWCAGRHCGADGGDGGCVAGRRDVSPVSLQVLRQVLAGFIQLVLVQGDVEHLWRALGKLLRRHQLHVDVPGLGLQTHHIVITFYPTQGKNLSLLSDSHSVNHT